MLLPRAPTVASLPVHMASTQSTPPASTLYPDLTATEARLRWRMESTLSDQTAGHSRSTRVTRGVAASSLHHFDYLVDRVILPGSNSKELLLGLPEAQSALRTSVKLAFFGLERPGQWPSCACVSRPASTRRG